MNVSFKITQQSGAYWKNDKENKMLTRINGVAFRNQEELDAWEKEQQEARERDHRKIGKEMANQIKDLKEKNDKMQAENKEMRSELDELKAQVVALAAKK